MINENSIKWDVTLLWKDGERIPGDTYKGCWVNNDSIDNRILHVQSCREGADPPNFELTLRDVSMESIRYDQIHITGYTGMGVQKRLYQKIVLQNPRTSNGSR